MANEKTPEKFWELTRIYTDALLSAVIKATTEIGQKYGNEQAIPNMAIMLAALRVIETAGKLGMKKEDVYDFLRQAAEVVRTAPGGLGNEIESAASN